MNAGRRTLAWKLYAIGILQFAILVLAAFGIDYATRAPPPHMRALEETALELEPVLEDRRACERVLDERGRLHGIDLTLYDRDERVRASSVDPPIDYPTGHRPPVLGHPHPDAPDHPAEPSQGRPPPNFPDVFAASLGPAHDYVLVARFTDRIPSFLAPLLTLLAGIAVIGFGALVSARVIARPLERLSETANALGEGDLSARTGVTSDDEVGDVARAFDQMADRVEQLVGDERELLANVSHELRTPLARIRVAMDLAAEGDAERARASVTDIAIDLAELEAIIDDILVSLRFERARHAGAPGLPLTTLEETTPRALADQAIEKFRRRHPERPIEASYGDGIATVVVDRVLLRRVLDNLLENAHKYSPDGNRPISVRVLGDEEDAIFEVVDRGIGIRAEDLANVFKPFFRVDRSRSRGAGGVGLGLTLAKRIVEAHGGTIGVTSSPGVGTTVRVVMPGRLAELGPKTARDP
jgi:two-component system OmpR family sensor kinase